MSPNVVSCRLTMLVLVVYSSAEKKSHAQESVVYSLAMLLQKLQGGLVRDCKKRQPSKAHSVAR